jgi:SET family sugar efflux transporter-like MFS transporter
LPGLPLLAREAAAPVAGSLARDAVPLAGAIAAYGVSMAFVSTTTSLFLADEVHATAGLIGLFFAVRGLASIAVNSGAGWLSDRLADRRALLLAAGVAGALGGVCFAVLRGYLAVLASGAVCLSVGGICFAQLFAYANELAVARARPVTRFTSAMRAVFSAAWVAGPPAGLFLATSLGFGPLYLAAGGLALASGLLGRWGLRRLAAPEPAVAAPAVPGGRPALPAGIWLLVVVIVILGVVNQMYGIDIALYVTRDLHLGAQLVGWMAGLCAGLEIPVMVIAARAAERFGPMRVMIAAAAGATAFFCLLPLARAGVPLLALQFLNAAWSGVALSIPMIMLQAEAPGGAGASSALYSSAFMSAGLLAGAITGATAGALGFGNLFWVCAALSAIAAGLLVARARLTRRAC